MTFPLDIPIIQAPMAGGMTTPELVAAVSNTGAIGSLGAGYMSPYEMRSAIKKIKTLTAKPFNVNLFIPEQTRPFYNPSFMNDLLAPLWHELSNTPLEFSPSISPSFEEQVEVLLEEKVPIFSFTFGIPSSSLYRVFQTPKHLRVGNSNNPRRSRAA